MNPVFYFIIGLLLFFSESICFGSNVDINGNNALNLSRPIAFNQTPVIKATDSSKSKDTSPFYQYVSVNLNVVHRLSLEFGYLYSWSEFEGLYGKYQGIGLTVEPGFSGTGVNLLLDQGEYNDGFFGGLGLNLSYVYNYNLRFLRFKNNLIGVNVIPHFFLMSFEAGGYYGFKAKTETINVGVGMNFKGY